MAFAKFKLMKREQARQKALYKKRMIVTTVKSIIFIQKLKRYVKERKERSIISNEDKKKRAANGLNKSESRNTSFEDSKMMS